MILILKKIFGDKSTRDIKKLLPIVDEINSIYAKISSISNDELRKKTDELKFQIKDSYKEIEEQINEKNKSIDENSELDNDQKDELYNQIEKLREEKIKIIDQKLEEILPSAFAILKETARRFKENEKIMVTANDFDRNLSTFKSYVSVRGQQAFYKNSWEAGGSTIIWDMVHYDVQLIGGIVLHQGKISEMSTGEGKTLVATLPIFLNALTGLGVHIVTVNDYLSKRDSEWMGPLFEFHGLTVDCIDKYKANSKERQKSYLADITYGTNNEYGFDYLRDNMVLHQEEKSQRKLHYAIVDEVDSVLIDDARTPLIISGPTQKQDSTFYIEIKPIVEKIFKHQKNLINTILADAKNAIAKNDSNAGLLLFRCFRGLPKYKPLQKLLNETGNKALLNKTQNFYMQDQGKEMPKADEPLFFVIDEKINSIELTEKGFDLLSNEMNDKNYFILPDVGSYISELDQNNSFTPEVKAEKKEKIMTDFTIKAERVHALQQMLKAYSLFEKDVEYVVLNNQVKIVDEQTGRIMEGRRYSDGLHQALEAKEECKVEEATQTYATITLQNFFRMYHKLAGMTGTAETEAREFWEIYKLDVVVIPTNKPNKRKDLEDKIYKTKKAKYNNLVTEIQQYVEKGHSVLVGTTSVDVSELLSRILTQKKIKHNVLNAKLHQKEAEIVASAGVSGVVTIATNMAGRGTDIKIDAKVKEAGGLVIIGTERHDSRRVDRQLRGRSGRQGDPGVSQFFVSMEDDLMRLFNSERIIKVMDFLKLGENEIIQHSSITKSIERAQKRMEENNFGIRKRLLEYDNVINKQRESIYSKRNYALSGEKVKMEITDMIYSILERHFGIDNTETFEEVNFDLIKIFGIDFSRIKDTYNSNKREELLNEIFEEVIINYKNKMQKQSEYIYPFIKKIYENNNKMNGRILLPYTDSLHNLNVMIKIDEVIKSNGKKIVDSLEKSILLSNIDHFWKEHLRELDDLKQSVQNVVYEQKDPLLIFKFEAFNLFEKMMFDLQIGVVQFLFKSRLNISVNDESKVKEDVLHSEVSELKSERKQEKLAYKNSGVDPASLSTNTKDKLPNSPIKVDKKPNRNDVCPCGSGKKYKHCHGKGD